MCEFMSVLVLKNGDILSHPMLDSHSDLVAYFQLPDENAHIRHFAKAELTPVDWLDSSTWQWRIDEPTRPGWLDEVESLAEAKARALAQRMVITEASAIPRLIVDGCWIIGGKAVVRDVRGGRILRVQDSAQVSDVRDSAQVSDVRGSARVSDVRGSARVSNVWGSARVSDVGLNVVLDASAKAHLVAP